MYKISIIFISIFLISIPSFLNAKTIILGTSPDYPPFEYIDKGEVKGLDIDIAKEIAKEIGYNLEIKTMDFMGLIPSLKSNKIDFVMSSMSMTQERLRNLDFSEVYYNVRFALVTEKSSSLKNLEHIKIVGAQLGSTMEQFLIKYSEKHDIQIISLQNNTNLMQELYIGRLDAVMMEESQAIEFIKNNSKLSYDIIENSDEGYAVAFNKGSDLLDEFNAAINSLKESGKLALLEKKYTENNKKYNSLIVSLSYIPGGILITLQYAIISVIFGFIIGSILSLFKTSDILTLRLFADFYTSVFRGTPLLLQLSLIYFALPDILNIKISAYSAGIIAFSLNSGAYVSEIIKSGILAVDKGQIEAAKSLGLPYFKMMRYIIFPQAIRKILPSLVNEVINLLKESAIISIIGESDLMRRANEVTASEYTYLEPLLVAAICYYLLVLILSYCAKIIEKKLAIK